MISLDVKTQKLLQNGGQGGTFGSVKSLKDGYSSNNYSANNYNDTVDSGSRYGSVKQNAIHSNGKLFFLKFLISYNYFNLILRCGRKDVVFVTENNLGGDEYTTKLLVYK